MRRQVRRAWRTRESGCDFSLDWKLPSTVVIHNPSFNRLHHFARLAGLESCMLYDVRCLIFHAAQPTEHADPVEKIRTVLLTIIKRKIIVTSDHS
jgi:hypothetical protein